jgi:hypothetical protein
VFGNAATAPANVATDIDVTVGAITFDNAHDYAIDGPSTLTLDTASGNAAINVASGTHVINAPLALAHNTSINVAPTDSMLTLAALGSSPAVAVTKEGAGTLVVNHVRSSSLVIDGGAVVVLPNSLSSGASKVGSLSIAADATLDLKDNKLITDTPVGTFTGGAYTGVQGEVARAYDFGSWDLPG